MASTPSAPEPRGPLVAQDVIRLDLRVQPTPEQAGFAEGRNSVVFERVGDAIDTEITLAGGVLDVDSFGVAISGPLGEQTPGDVERVVVNRRLPDLDAVRAELVEEAPVLGLDAALVDEWADMTAGGQPVSRVFTGQRQDPAITAEARPSSGDDSWVVNYVFSFGFTIPG